METLHVQLTEQFHKWEQRGRGWQVFDEPVYPEPPFVPFDGHYQSPAPVVDDGRRPTFLSSLFRKVTAQPEAPPVIPEPEEEPEPQILIRDSLLELQTSLPAKLDISKEAFEQFLLNLSLCREPITFELLGVANRVTAQFATHPDDAPLVRRQLQAYFPEANFQTQESTLEQVWTTGSGEDELVVEFGLAREFMLPLASGKLDPFIGIIGALSELQTGELGLFQVLFQPAHEPWSESITRSVTHADGKPFFVNSPELASAAENKTSKQLYAAVVRIAVKAGSEERKLQLASDLAGSLRVFAHPKGNELIPLSNADYLFEEHIEDMLRRQSRRSGMLLNSDELIGFVHLPSSAVRSPALQRDTGKTKAAPKMVQQTSGVLLGNNVHAGESIPVRLTPEQRVKHCHIIGASGTGKSTLLFNLICQDIQNWQGIAVIDPHGDLVEKILGVIPPERIADVILVDPSDEEYSIGFNILSAHSDHEKNLLASDLISVFQRLSASWGDQMNSVLQNAILAFLESNRRGTLADMRRFLIEPAFRNEFLKSVQDPDVVYYWQKGFQHLSGNKSIGSIITRLETFLAPKPIRYMVSQPENRLDFADITDNGKIFLAKLPEGVVGKENSYLLGTLLISKFQQLAMSRQAKQIAARRDFMIFADEFYNYITPSMAEILSGARKYRIGLTLAHHELHQLRRNAEVESAVMSHPFTRVVFRVGDDDAKKLAEGFSSFEARDLKNLETGQAICRVERSDFDFNLSVPLPAEPNPIDAAKRRQEVITASRAKYGTPRADVEAMLAKLREPVTQVKPLTSPPVAPIQPAPPQPVVPQLAEAPKHSEVPKTTGSEKEVVTDSEKELVGTAVEPVSQDSASLRQRGIGGNQHNLIRERIEAAAREYGYSTSREHRVGQGQKVDVVLEKPNRAIACEIAITTTIDHEVGNVEKCLKGGYKHVAVISPIEDRLDKIAQAVRGCLAAEEFSRVGFYTPEQFIAHIRELAGQDSTVLIPAAPSEMTHGKYKVKTKHATLTEEEHQQRDAATIAILNDVMRQRK